MGIILGLMAAVCWGAADFMARYATRIVGTYRSGISGLAWGLYLLVLGL